MQTKSSSQSPSLPALELGNMSLSPSTTVSPEAGLTDTSPQGTQVRAGENVSGGDGHSAIATKSTEPVESETQPQAVVDPGEEAKDGPPAPLPLTIDTSAPALARQNSEAIGPDLPTPMLQNFPQTGPHIQFILLLASAGTRHPFQLNERYLKRRNVAAMGMDGKFDPSVISVYNLKELIFKDWRDDWDGKPSSPSAIRLIYFGQLLADNTSLKECKIQTDGATNVLHISIKPQEAMDDDDAGKAGKSSMSRDREGSAAGRGCRCVIL
ncbi:hypothetical protein K461DRAFT_268318 [Myriangium duriaei CBS 260.36]|uniref:Ubiquitin-like domain-containing protein n=1 Tax=Myriangium duriaei CBS 260.36 TaxID=1168546 RepID=A0A9P4MFG4_9PEZI|nr:hypothetical protein K461DRAFT_268318 [Myriangium duriaei CBS 260.36]